MKVIKQTIKYRVPDWHYCNHIKPGSLGKPSKDVCTFCVKLPKNHGYSCAIYNMPLAVEADGMIQKTRSCVRATAGFKVEVTHEPDSANINPKDLIKATLDSYIKTKKDLISQGYPEVMADKLAREVLLK